MENFTQCMKVFAAGVKAMAEIEGMKAENQHSLLEGKGIIFDYSAFVRVIEQNDLTYNAVSQTLRGEFG